MKRFVGFNRQDATTLVSLGEPLGPVLPAIVDEFYAAIRQDGDVWSVIERSETDLDQLRDTLHAWLLGLFRGTYDESYFRERARIGYAHVRTGMPQHYMVTGMRILRRALVRAVRDLHRANEDRAIESVHKILDLELAVMLESYREAQDERIRQVERELWQRRLDESKHLANVGQLAATLAHEIKNPLTGISGAVQVILGALPVDDPHREIAGEILTQIDRLDAAATDLLIYARPKPPERKRQPVGQVLQRALLLLRQEPHMRGLVIHLDGLECAAEASIDDAQFQQVISNLLLNAAYACRNGGEVTLRLSDKGGEVIIDVDDSGVGMTAEILERSFEPFFTTKAKGTGLGLPICRRIIEAHAGRIDITARPGVGTKITIALPSES